MYVVIRLCEPDMRNGFIHWLMHILLYYIRMIILCYANIVMTLPVLRKCNTMSLLWQLSIKTPESQSVYAEIQIAYNDDFRCFGYPTMMHKWDLLVATLSAHNYEITDASDKEFVGISIRTTRERYELLYGPNEDGRGDSDWVRYEMCPRWIPTVNK
jgi:hypothetical protein